MPYDAYRYNGATAQASPTGPTAPVLGGGYFYPRYFSPSFFTSAYWDHGLLVATIPTFPAPPYFASRYFASRYFTPWYWPTVASVGKFRDRDVYQAIQGLLDRTGEFDAVTFGGPEDQESVGAMQVLTCEITPRRVQTAPDVNPKRKVRKVEYLLTLRDRRGGQAEAYEALDRLDSVVRNALEQQSYGYCIADRSLLGAAQYDQQPSPDVSLSIVGTFTYVVNTASGYAEDS